LDAPQSLQDSIWRVLTLKTCPHRNRRYTFARILPLEADVSSIFCQKYSLAEELTGYAARV